MHGILSIHVHYSMLIQDSPTNGTFTWINQYKYWNSNSISMTVLYRPNPVMFITIDTTNLVTNTITRCPAKPPGYNTICEIIAILNTMTDTSFSISIKAHDIRVPRILSPHSIDLLNTPDIRKLSVWKDVRTLYLHRSMDRT